MCVLPVRQYGYAFQAFSWMFRAEDGANILTNDGTLLQDREVKREQTKVSLMAGEARLSLVLRFKAGGNNRPLLTSASGKFCVCTVPSPHLFRRAHF